MTYVVFYLFIALAFYINLKKGTLDELKQEKDVVTIEDLITGGDGDFFLAVMWLPAALCIGIIFPVMITLDRIGKTKLWKKRS